MRIAASLLLAVLLIGCAPTDAISQRTDTSMRQVILLDGDEYDITIAPSTLDLAGVELATYAYNNQIPGPVLRVKQGSTVTIHATNELPEPTTIHWHGLRHALKDDGVPGVSQDPIQTGESFTYTLQFPDAGMFWYHPHVREDRQQDKGLAGIILVEPAEPWPEAQEEILVLDDILLDPQGKEVPHGSADANYALMGRFGNTMMVNGKDQASFQAVAGERVRFFIVDVANVRPFNLSFGTPIEIIGSDIGLARTPLRTDSVVISPAERYIVDVVFPEEGTYHIRNINPWVDYDLGTVTVRAGPEDDAGIILPENDIAAYERYFTQEADLTLRIDAEVGHMGGMMGGEHMIRGMHSVFPIEWEDTMEMMNAHMTSDDVQWFFEDVATGKRNMDIGAEYKVGDIVKFRIINDAEGEHPMQHPVHLHGQRFLVVSLDGERPEQLAWKDTVNIPGGSEAEILIDFTNPGEWMMHCHIAEHLEAGLMTSVMVLP